VAETVDVVICHIWDADYPWDIRVEKVCQSLQVNHEVHLVCRNEKRSPRHEVLDGTIIHRLPSLPRWLGPCHMILGLPFFFNPTWLRAIWSTVKRSRADLILVRDIPLALTAILVGRWYNIPVLLDLAENYPAMLEDQRLYSPKSVIGGIVRHPALARLVEKIVLKWVDHIIVVVEESRDRLIDMGIDSSRITIITNTPPLDRWSEDAPSTVASNDHDTAHFVYLGNLDAKRDWGYAKEYVEAMWLMLQQTEADDYVIATNETHSVREFLEVAFGHVGLDWKKYVELDPRYNRPAEVDLHIGDASKAKKKLGWEPKTKFVTLTKLMVDADIELLRRHREGEIRVAG